MIVIKTTFVNNEIQKIISFLAYFYTYQYSCNNKNGDKKLCFCDSKPLNTHWISLYGMIRTFLHILNVNENLHSCTALQFDGVQSNLSC